MGCDFLGCIYGKVRRFVRTFSGRKRYNVLGALNFVSKKMTTITNDTYITFSEVIELLCDLSLEYAGKSIRLVLDNASYQKCYIVQYIAADLGIELMLNLIEKSDKLKICRFFNKFSLYTILQSKSQSY